MSYGTENPEEFTKLGELLGDIVQARASMMVSLDRGQYEDANNVADALLTRYYVRETPGNEASDSVDIPPEVVPHAAIGIALLADASLAAIIVGDIARAADMLNKMGEMLEQIPRGVMAEKLMSIGITRCEHGRPSLDGDCLKIPPCPTR